MSAIAGHVRVYVDGSCPKPDGPGGWGWLLVDAVDQVFASGSGGVPETTNNRMELTAAIEGVRALRANRGRVEAAQGLLVPDPIFVVSDSQYVTRGITEYIDNWKRKRWHKVKNPEFWKVLDQLATASPFPLGWRWVKGHDGNPFNEHADKLAGLASAAYKINEEAPVVA